MTFLPIADRELRLASRKRSTFWLRVTAALVALIIGVGFLVIEMIAWYLPFGGRVQLGGPLFSTLTTMAFAAALSAGLFFTSDCLSEEKREGTLGFLFLTDLHGYDVVLGKLAVTGLRCMFALLAICPVLAFTQLMGGLETATFWKTLLALLHTLFFSLTVGIFVSAISRDAQKAMIGTILILLLFLAGGQLVDFNLGMLWGQGFKPVFSLASPAYIFASANDWGRGFWWALLVGQGVAWMMLAASCILIPRTWQTRAKTASPILSRWNCWWKYGGAKRRLSVRRKLLDVHPVMWLAGRERWQGIVLWLITSVVTILMVTLLLMELPSQTWMVWSYVGGGLSLLLYLWAASQAARFFVDARRNGTMELLLGTPLNGQEIIMGPWRAILRLGALPVIIFVLVHGFGSAFASFESWSGMTQAFGQSPSVIGMQIVFPIASAVAVVFVVVSNLYAISWFGFWMGLTSRNAQLAALKSITFVWIIPWFVIAFASALLTGLIMMLSVIPAIAKTQGSTPPIALLWFPLLTTLFSAGLSLGKNVIFTMWARRKLFSEFRELAVRAVAPIRMRPAVTPQLPLKQSTMAGTK